MARAKKSKQTPTGKIALTDVEIEKAKGKLPGIGRRCRKLEEEIACVKASAKEEAKGLQEKLNDLKAEQAELEEMILNGYRSEEAQQELFDGDEEELEDEG